MEYVKSKVRDVLDFPQKGVVFKDLTTAFKDPRALHIIGWDLSQLYRDKGVTKVVGIESRGFIGGSILAFELGAVSCRCVSLANFLPIPSRLHMTRSMARIQSKSIVMR